MYMSFNRLRFDACAEKSFLQEAKGMSDYILRPPISDSPCIPSSPLVIMQRAGDSIENGPRVPFDGPVDVDTKLRGIDRRSNKCANSQYIPKCSQCGVMSAALAAATGYCEQCKAPLGMGYDINFGSCDFKVDCTRNSNPSGNVRGRDTTRFDPLCSNPQEHVFFPGRYMIDTRTIVKDNYRPCIPYPKVNSMNPLKNM